MADGSGANEVVRDRKSGKTLAVINPRLVRPSEVELLIGDASRARRELGWEQKITLETLCEKMVEADLRRAERGWSF